MMEDKKKKKWYKSKTLWVNAISLVAIIVQLATGKEILDPTAQATILTVVNVILRAITKEELV